ncbi:MAG: hypothetical protein A2359_04310 [Candidatus Moranbacteria bacterium RIFOXYB1_FULL_43_19]|nr:MAG: hypothetical protein A2359_04310 [Candidatus Moranbacteria bacterium RIFOXYB1_FULL_43_19]OGI32877.1 MAG: hypothetical protein A2420_04465 [Candidatus Moranbacteria bacterium RIFOXYC1_FULL_44_13]OGI37357.1 MAG: hypothetical protein A2612_00595 [Candidatus Moranbacteria bacterium RIFOXYD1_FULL_44_12]
MGDRKNKKKKVYAHFFVAAALGGAFFFVAQAEANASTFFENFGGKGALNESGSIESSASSDWWLNSGGQMKFRKGEGWTVQKKISSRSSWKKIYQRTNSADTDGGKHPQNIFRLITRTSWQNFSQEAHFKVKKFNLSQSSNRNASNGLLLMSRYEDSDNLYYAGVRVDGYAVIKKKKNGEYFTLAYDRYFSRKEYSRQSKSRSHLLPKNKWIALKTEIRNLDGGKVEIKLFIQKKKNWVLIAEALDEPGKYGGDAILGEGYAGIRTDFMDVQFDKYRINGL